MVVFPKISVLTKRHILIEFEPEINENLLHKLLNYKNILSEKYPKEKIEVTNTYNSILISYMFTIEDVYNEFSVIKSIISSGKIGKLTKQKIFYIPVCYHKDFGLDLQLLSEQNEFSEKEIIRLHTHPSYTIFFIGFLPGFLYLGGLDSRLAIPRKKSPRLQVEKGAVGIGENQTGIYPKMSPGGWQIIGNSPIEFFDKNKAVPSEFSAGDKIKFFEVSKKEFYGIKERVKNDDYKLKSDTYES